MKVLLILTNLRGGGAEKAMLTIAKGLVEREHEVRLLLLEHCIEHTVPEGIMFHALLPPDRLISRGWLGKRVMALRLRQ